MRGGVFATLQHNSPTGNTPAEMTNLQNFGNQNGYLPLINQLLEAIIDQFVMNLRAVLDGRGVEVLDAEILKTPLY